jgi:hypothetical protein
MLVARPLGDVNVSVTVPEVVGAVNEYENEAKLASVVLGTGVPPSNRGVTPVVPEIEIVVPAAMGFRRMLFASETKKEYERDGSVRAVPASG